MAEAFGQQPTAFRAGRYGIGTDTVAALVSCGYRVDSSVSPLFCEAHKGGPDFADAPLTPYYLAYDRATQPGSSGVLELPLSTALHPPMPRALELAWARAPKPYLTKRVLRKLGVARVQWLRPSYSSLDDMCALARRLTVEGVPLLNLIFHSSEAIVGGSPYNRTAGELEAFFDRLDRFLAFATQELGAVPRTFREFRDLHVGAAA